MDSDNPCLRCGACCAFFRASFYWTEAESELGGTVPASLTIQVGPYHCAMRGTEMAEPRCVALLGTIGEAVRCTIYEKRSSSCRDFPRAWNNGEPNERCDRARAAWGLPPLAPPEEDSPRPRPRPRPRRKAA